MITHSGCEVLYKYQNFRLSQIKLWKRLWPAQYWSTLYLTFPLLIIHCMLLYLKWKKEQGGTQFWLDWNTNMLFQHIITIVDVVLCVLIITCMLWNICFGFVAFFYNNVMFDIFFVCLGLYIFAHNVTLSLYKIYFFLISCWFTKFLT